MARRVTLSMVVSLDGYINGPGGLFGAPEWSADLDAWTDEMPALYDTLLYGRIAWQMMADFWPRAGEAADVTPPMARLAQFMNDARKIVFSRCLTSTDAWANSSLADADVATVVARERARPGRDMVIFAGARFAQTTLAAGVVDRLSLLTLPVLYGHGTRLFEGHVHPRAARLTELRRMDTGAVLSRYDLDPIGP
jgi:dihydrofolate reductase